ncbi:MAG: FMN-binding protein [Clostridia bacterium]|nr:FMN-binding protein [Clostridia bacterium]
MKKRLSILLCMFLILFMFTAAASTVFTGTGQAIGFGGNVIVTITLTDGVITEVTADGPKEILGVYALEQLPISMVEGNTINVDTIAAATVTSTAVIEAARLALTDAGVDPDDYMSAPGAASCFHEGLCTAPTTCTKCGRTNVTIAEIALEHDLYYVDLGEHHQYQCKNCDYAHEPAEHRGHCVTMTSCFDCGLTDVTVPANNKYHLMGYVDLGDMHQYQCTLCGQSSTAAEKHTADCTQPSTCTVCGTTDLEATEVSIIHSAENYAYDDLGDQHQFHCYVCGYREEAAAHDVSCSQPTRCYTCNAAVSASAQVIISHSLPDSGFTYTAKEHSYTCSNCGKVITEQHYFYGDSPCFCGATAPVHTPGDTNSDSFVDMRDALSLLKKLAGWNITIDTAAADCNGDGSVNMRDALLLLKHLAGWDVKLQ